MKTSCLLVALLLAAPLWAADERVTTNVLSSGLTGTVSVVEAKVLKAYVAKDGDAVFKAYVVLWKDQEVVINDILARSNYKEGDMIRFSAMKHASSRGGTNSGVLMFQIMPETRIPVFKPTPRAVMVDMQPVFFECRGNEIFYIDREALAKKDADENYTVDPGLKVAGLTRLRPREGVHGETAADLAKEDSRYQKLLRQLDPKTRTIAFLCRDDSPDVLRHARELAEAAGFKTTSEPLAEDKPITFGQTK